MVIKHTYSPTIGWLFPEVESHPKYHRKNDWAQGYPAYLGEHHWLRPDHQRDVFREVLVAIDPHYSNNLPQGNPKHGKASTISVHQIEHILAI